MGKIGTDMRPLFDAVLKHVPAPKGDPDAPLQLQIAAVDYSSFLGRIAIGRIRRGTIRKAQQVAVLAGDKPMRIAKIGVIHTFQGLDKVETDVAAAGEIVSVTGIEDFVHRHDLRRPSRHPKRCRWWAWTSPRSR